MFLRISDRWIGASGLVLLAACSSQPDNSKLAEAERNAASDAGKLLCAVGGARELTPDCTEERSEGAEGTVLTIRHRDGGFRRFHIVKDGRGIVTADGAEPAKVEIIAPGQIQVTVAGDVYRLPARIAG